MRRIDNTIRDRQSFNHDAYFFQGDEFGDDLKGCGLLFYEGTHHCSRGNTYELDRQDLLNLANNTNKIIREKGCIMLFPEHQDSLDNVLGFIRGNFFVDNIDDKYISRKPELESIRGRAGLFAREITITNPEFSSKPGHPVSCTLDVENQKIKSLSLVKKPALGYAALFSKHQGHGAIDYREAIEGCEKQEKLTEELHRRFQIFLETIWNIQAQAAEEMGGNDEKLMEQASVFIEDIYKLMRATPNFDESQRTTKYAGFSATDFSPNNSIMNMIKSFQYYPD